MKKILVICLGLSVLASWVCAEPILTEQVESIPKYGLEVGVVGSYSIDTWKWEYVGGDNKVSVRIIQIPVKYGLTDKFQLNLNIPYRSWRSKRELDSSETSANNSGLGQISVGGKYRINDTFAVMLEVQAPAGDVNKLLGEGMNEGLFLIASNNVRSVKVTGNIGYLIKNKYQDEHSIEYDPADPLIMKFAAEYPINAFSLFSEAQAQIFGKSKVGGQDILGTGPTDSTVDLMMGTYFHKRNFKYKLGFQWAIGKEDFRGGLFPFYDSWDWKIIWSASYMFNLKGGGK